MGREALVHAEVDGEAGEVKALLESRELILRGEPRRRFLTAEMEDVRVAGEFLLFRCGGQGVSLRLGEKAAAGWLKAISTPPPSLRDKLGLGDGRKAIVVGHCDDPDLDDALRDARTDDPSGAAMVVARIDGAENLSAALAVCGHLPLWAIYPKGKANTFGDSAIREQLRARGWRDTKSCSVSDRLTATRYNPTSRGDA